MVLLANALKTMYRIGDQQESFKENRNNKER